MPLFLLSFYIVFSYGPCLLVPNKMVDFYGNVLCVTLESKFCETTQRSAVKSKPGNSWEFNVVRQNNSDIYKSLILCKDSIFIFI